MLLSAGPQVHRHLTSQAVHRAPRPRPACRSAHLRLQTSLLNKLELEQHLPSTESVLLGVAATLRNALAVQAATGTATAVGELPMHRSIYNMRSPHTLENEWN